jgi:hypothetical protein
MSDLTWRDARHNISAAGRSLVGRWQLTAAMVAFALLTSMVVLTAPSSAATSRLATPAPAAPFDRGVPAGCEVHIFHTVGWARCTDGVTRTAYADCSGQSDPSFEVLGDGSRSYIRCTYQIRGIYFIF